MPRFILSKLFLLSAALAVLLFFIFIPPIPQDPAYHYFADQRTLLGISNFFDVMSNLPFILIGLGGLFALMAGKAVLPSKNPLMYRIFFIGVTAVGFGSAWYHLNPGNSTLVWDRLPMTIAFMAFFCIVVSEYLDVGLGKRLLWPLLAVGIFSVVYWHVTESAGQGDLRPYAVVQFFPLLLMPLILYMGQPLLSHGAYLWGVLAAYIAAKLLEAADAPLFILLGGAIGGHALKHIVAALGAWLFLLALLKRRKRML